MKARARRFDSITKCCKRDERGLEVEEIKNTGGTSGTLDEVNPCVPVIW